MKARAADGPHLSCGAMASEEVRLRVCLPIWRRGCGIRSRLLLAPAAFCSSFRTSCERFLDTRMADGVTRPGFFPQLEHRLGARSFDFDTPDLRMSILLASDSDLGHAFSDAWALFREEADGVVDVTRSPGLLSHPAETVPAQHRREMLQPEIQPGLDGAVQAGPGRKRRGGLELMDRRSNVAHKARAASVDMYCLMNAS